MSFLVQFLNFSHEQQKCEGQRKQRARVLISKVDFSDQVSQRNRTNLPIDPILSNWPIFIIKSQPNIPQMRNWLSHKLAKISQITLVQIESSYLSQ